MRNRKWSSWLKDRRCKNSLTYSKHRDNFSLRSLRELTCTAMLCLPAAVEAARRGADAKLRGRPRCSILRRIPYALITHAE
eukprot:2715285-Pleurochrysis_carterae.AAC.1